MKFCMGIEFKHTCGMCIKQFLYMLTVTHVDMMRNSDVIYMEILKVLAVCKLCLLVEIMQRNDPLRCVVIIGLRFCLVHTC